MTDDSPSIDHPDIDLPDVEETAVKRHEVHDAFTYDLAFRMGFIGLGQGGGRIAETFHGLGYRRVACINSAQADLADISDDILKLDLGTGGAGQDIEKGRLFLKNRKEDIWDLLLRAVGDNPDYLLVCVSLGGGTGSGGATTLVRTCQEYMDHHGRDPKRVGVVISLPNPYEGQRTAHNAVHAFEELRQLNLSPVVIIDNKRMEKIYPQYGSTQLFPICNKQVAGLFHLFNRLAVQRSKMITFDRADYATLLDSGTIAFGVGQIKKYETKADLTEAIRDQLERTVLAEVDIKQGKFAGCIFLGGEHIMAQVPMEYFGESFSLLSRMLAEGSVVFRGVYVGSGDDLRCYTMLSGLPTPEKRLAELRKEAQISFDSNDTASHLGL